MASSAVFGPAAVISTPSLLTTLLILLVGLLLARLAAEIGRAHV